jgi:hypothetical protein
MKKPLTIWVLALMGGLFLGFSSAQAHCDAANGPVATAAVKALETKNVNLILPYAPAAAEVELAAAFEQALIVRGQDRRPRRSRTGTSWRRPCACTGQGRRRPTRG